MTALPTPLQALIVPPRCAACGGPCPSEMTICAQCEAQLAKAVPLLEPGPSGVDLCVAVAPFEDTARAVVVGLKFGSRLRLAEVAAEAIRRACPAAKLHGSVVPVPAAPFRWRWRGFDPAEEIALALARTAGLPFEACLRRSHGPRQVGRRRSARLSHPPGVSLRAKAPPRALLVDDVYTTGATLAACAGALRSGGCQQVLALTLARAL